jgi:hypothetical protein
MENEGGYCMARLVICDLRMLGIRPSFKLQAAIKGAFIYAR